MGWRVSGGIWMVSLGGLDCKYAGWGAAGGIWESSRMYLQMPGRQGTCLGDPKSCDPAQVRGEILIQVPYSNIETLAVSFETIRLEAVRDYKAFKLQKCKP